MKLRTISAGDLPLYESILCDPNMMAELGGAFPAERIPRLHRNAVDAVETGRAWVYKILPEEAHDRAAGVVCIWENSWRDQIINEIGWMVLPSFQSRGLGSKAVSAILDLARSEKRFDVIHAFPSTTNVRSNSICMRIGFSKIEECDLEYAGRMLLCNHWQLDLHHP